MPLTSDAAELHSRTLTANDLSSFIKRFIHGKIEISDEVSYESIMAVWAEKCSKHGHWMPEILPVFFETGAFWKISASNLAKMIAGFEAHPNADRLALNVWYIYRRYIIGIKDPDIDTSANLMEWCLFLLEFPTLRANLSSLEIRRILSFVGKTKAFFYFNFWPTLFDKMIEHPEVWRHLSDCHELTITSYIKTHGWLNLNSDNIGLLVLFGPYNRARYFLQNLPHYSQYAQLVSEFYEGIKDLSLAEITAQKLDLGLPRTLPLAQVQPWVANVLPTVMRELVLIGYLMRVRAKHYVTMHALAVYESLYQNLRSTVEAMHDESLIALMDSEAACIQAICSHKTLGYAALSIDRVLYIVHAIYHSKMSPEAFEALLPTFKDSAVFQRVVTYCFIYCEALRPVLLKPCWIDSLDIYLIHEACCSEPARGLKGFVGLREPIDLVQMQQHLIADYPVSAKLLLQLTSPRLKTLNALAQRGHFQEEAAERVTVKELAWLLERQPGKLQQVIFELTSSPRVQNKKEYVVEIFKHLAVAYPPSLDQIPAGVMFPNAVELLANLSLHQTQEAVLAPTPRRFVVTHFDKVATVLLQAADEDPSDAQNGMNDPVKMGRPV